MEPLELGINQSCNKQNTAFEKQKQKQNTAFISLYPYEGAYILTYLTHRIYI